MKIKVPLLWQNRTVLLVASGHSLAKSDLDLARGRVPVAVVNDCCYRAPWADMLYACDARWWDAHNGVPDFVGLKLTHSPDAANRWGLGQIAGRAAPGLSRDPNYIHTGGNGGYQLLNIAALAGAKRILLTGYDMRAGPTGEEHWFGSHPEEVRVGMNFAKWRDAFDTTPPDLAAMGVEVINCTRATALTCYPRAALADVLPALAA